MVVPGGQQQPAAAVTAPDQYQYYPSWSQRKVSTGMSVLRGSVVVPGYAEHQHRKLRDHQPQHRYAPRICLRACYARPGTGVAYAVIPSAYPCTRY
eukprot:193116-Rhodomonas_salina.1